MQSVLLGGPVQNGCCGTAVRNPGTWRACICCWRPTSRSLRVLRTPASQFSKQTLTRGIWTRAGTSFFSSFKDDQWMTSVTNYFMASTTINVPVTGFVVIWWWGFALLETARP